MSPVKGNLEEFEEVVNGIPGIWGLVTLSSYPQNIWDVFLCIHFFFSCHKYQAYIIILANRNADVFFCRGVWCLLPNNDLVNQVGVPFKLATITSF